MYQVKKPMPGVIYPPVELTQQYVDAGELSLQSLTQTLREAMLENANSVALYTATGAVTYAELDSITTRFAGALLDRGLEPLDRVLFQSVNSPELVYALLGCLKAGLIPVCTLPAHREIEIGFLGRHTDARVHIVQGDDAKFDLQGFALRMQHEIPTVQHIISLNGGEREGVSEFESMVNELDIETATDLIDGIEHDPFQVGIFQLSGGTTGTPKVIPRMQNDYLLNAKLTVDMMGITADDINFMPMPIMHNACMICCLLPTLLAGAAFMIPADMSPESWAQVMKRNPPSIVFLIRPLIPRLESTLEIAPEVEQSIRKFWSADAARLLREKYNKPAHAMFGMSEGMNMYVRESDPDEVADWTVGRPMSRFDELKLVKPGTDQEVDVGEIGELVCRGPYTLSGYYNAPERNTEAFTADGFYKPGDLMIQKEIDDELYYSFAGRLKDVVDRGTEKINCEEVENAVSTHKSVAGCAVVGMPDPVLGERVCAYIVTRAGQSAPDVPLMQQHLQQLGLAKFKWPERIESIEALPLTKVGKLDKAVLREDISTKLKRGGG